MIPFAMILTPFVIFFFNFSMEAYKLTHKKTKKKKEIQETEKEEETCGVR